MQKIVLFCALFFGLSQASNAQNLLPIQDSIVSKYLDRSTYFTVQLPVNYDQNKKKHYPVVYVVDGEMWLNTAVNVEEFYSGGFMPEMILVGLNSGDDRTYEFSPTEQTMKYGMPFNDPTGGANQYMDYIEKELFPFIEATYRTKPYTTLIGHSYGGLFGAHVLVEKPELFNNYILIDPSVEWDDQVLVKKARALDFSSETYAHKGIYISLSGQLHMQDPSITIDNVREDQSDYTLFARSILDFGEALGQGDSKLNITEEFFPEDLHGTVAIPSIRSGLMEVFVWFQMEETYKFNSFDTPVADLKALVEYRAEKLKENFGYEVSPYPEDLFNGLGYMNLQMDQPDKAKMYLEMAVKYFPHSANTYDSLSDYYIAIQQPKQALELVKKAAEIDDSSYYQNKIQELEKEL